MIRNQIAFKFLSDELKDLGRSICVVSDELLRMAFVDPPKAGIIQDLPEFILRAEPGAGPAIWVVRRRPALQ